MMATVEYQDPNRVWHRRAERVGFKIWLGRKIADMTESEIAVAFQQFGQMYGIWYTW